VSVKHGSGVDQGDVERAKLLFANKTPMSVIAKQLGCSVQTARRYVHREDETPEQEEVRNLERERCIKEAYQVIHLAEAQVINSLKKGEIKGKDAAVIWGIHSDKVLAWEAKSAGIKDTKGPLVTFNFTTTDNSPPLPHTTEVPLIRSKVQGDDMRLGVGKDLLRLSGGSPDKPGAED
jgi:hypothetical protein